MKRILVPTDFSPIADNAMLHAIEIAEHFSSELFLYHVYYINKVDYNLDYPKEQQPYKKQVELSMNRTRLKFIEKITQKGLTLHTKVEEDSILSLFERKVNEYGIDLIVMGSKGASGIEKIIFGSIAATALKMAKIPVLVVPPKIIPRPLKHIILAMDYRPVSQSALTPLQKLALKFGAKVTILSIDTKSNKDHSHIKHLSIDGVDTTYRKIAIDKSINQSIDTFIQKESCDLLCMVRREKGFFERLIKKSITESQVYNNRVPLLVLPDK